VAGLYVGDLRDRDARSSAELCLREPTLFPEFPDGLPQPNLNRPVQDLIILLGL